MHDVDPATAPPTPPELFEQSVLPATPPPDFHARLADDRWAEACLERALHDMERGSVVYWLPRLAMVAANELLRRPDFLPVYGRYLDLTDGGVRPDWYANQAPERFDDMRKLSGRFGQTDAEFATEFERVRRALGPPGDDVVLDIGCAGGLWAVGLAQLGYRVLGTDRDATLIAKAVGHAARSGVADLAKFQVDDLLASTLPDGAARRVLCISVTLTLPDQPAFEALAGLLDRVSRSGAGGADGRRVILGSNRWQPSRLDAVSDVLDDGIGHPSYTYQRLKVIEVSWWLTPSHVEGLRSRFDHVDIIGETTQPIDGTRIDLLLR